jgi:Hemerythrin HHE cation binding domain
VIVAAGGVDTYRAGKARTDPAAAGSRAEERAVPDITELILNDHETFRRAFAALDEVRYDVEHGKADAGDLLSAWTPLADLLDLHAAAEEVIFYPQLLRKADPDGEETEDAIHDHNDIRDGVARARKAEPGSKDWWKAVQDTREANDEHMGEEEHEGLADFRLHADRSLRNKLGDEFTAYKLEHPNATKLGADGESKDPESYVENNS